MEYALFGIQLLKIACITIIAFILIATLVFIICLCVVSGQASQREEQAIYEYLHREKTRRLKQANRELKEGCIMQSKTEEMERVYKEYYSKPLKIKKNKLRKKAINAYKNHKIYIKKDYNVEVTFKDVARDIRYWDKRGYCFSYPNIKAITRYLRSLE